MASRNCNTVTMTDVATYANVSQATVSRVLNNHAKTNEQTRKAVYKAINKLGYQATPLNRRASAQGTNASKQCFGLLLCSLAEQVNLLGLSFFGTIIEGIEKIVKANNADIMLMTLKASSAHTDVEIEKLKSLSGVIILGHPTEKLTKVLEQNDIKFVISSSANSNFTCNMVMVDNIEAGIKASRYILQKNKRRIGFIATRHDEERLDGLQVGLLKNNIFIMEKDRKIVDSTDISSFIECIHHWIDEGGLPEVIVVSFLEAAQAVKKILELNKIKVPQDVMLFSFSHSDNEDTIPCMKLHPFTMGEKAANRLFELIRNPGDKNHQIIVPMSLDDK